jgi:hypothetical protein
MRRYDPTKKGMRVAQLLSYHGDSDGKPTYKNEGALLYNKHGFLTVMVGEKFLNVYFDHEEEREAA